MNLAALPREWATRYILGRSGQGIPFVDGGRDWSGCDCWGLVRLVYREELGIELPSHAGDYADVFDGPALARASQTELPRWRRLDDPVPMAVWYGVARGRHHVGVMIDPARMLHIEAGKMACVEPVDRWRRWTAGFWVPNHKSTTTDNPPRAGFFMPT